VALDRSQLLAATAAGRLVWSAHGWQRAKERRFTRDDVLSALEHGEVIEDYPTPWPCPAILLLALVSEHRVHVVAAMDEERDEAYIITVYEPTADKFEADWKTRRPR
jgi:hypothetical protein